MASFAFNNQSPGTSYVVLEITPNSAQIHPSSTPKYLSGSSFSSWSGISREMVVVNDYQLGIVVPEGSSGFDFTPGITIPISESFIRGAGNCSVTVYNGFNIDITPDELNRDRTFLPEITSSTAPPAYNNIYSFFFDQNGATPALKERFETPQNAGLSPTNNFTISVWAKPYISDPPDDGTLLDNANSTNGYVLMHDDIGSGAWNFQIQKSGETKRVRSSVVPTANIWQNIIGVFADGTGSIYIDGQLRGTDHFTSSPTIGVNTTQNPRVGTTQGSSAGTIDPYSGSLQNMSLWGAAFSWAEVNEIYNGGIPTDLNTHSRIADGIAWWQFGGDGESGSFNGTNWIYLNAFDNATYTMTSANMDFASRVADTPPS